MSEIGTLFEPHGDLFLPTEAAGNPWGELTGGGPVAGLLARAVESAIDDDQLVVARLTVDLLRPVPRTPVDVSTRVLRAGKRLQVLEAVLTADGVELARGVAQALRRTDVDGDGPTTPVPFEGPEGIEDGALLPAELGLRWGVHDVIDVRWIANQLTEDGTSRAWMRIPLPLLPGEPLSPLARTSILVDCISAASPLGTIFGPWINSDITLYLHREPEGEWLGMEMTRDVQPSGLGVATARLFDEHGPVGSASEAVLVNQLG
ncbi:thioesterase family protein [Parasphingorhabdus pacifica]